MTGVKNIQIILLHKNVEQQISSKLNIKSSDLEPDSDIVAVETI